MSSALLSAAHVLALAIGLPAVFLRGRALRRLANSVDSFDDLYAADAWWGIAAVLWLATGLARLFGPWEKGTAYYLSGNLGEARKLLEKAQASRSKDNQIR